MTETPAARRKRQKLQELLAKAKDYVMSPAEIDAQRKSWVCGEMLLQYPTMTYDEAAAQYDTAQAAVSLPVISSEPIAFISARDFGKLLSNQSGFYLMTVPDEKPGVSQYALFTWPTPTPEALPPSSETAGGEEEISRLKIQISQYAYERDLARRERDEALAVHSPVDHVEPSPADQIIGQIEELFPNWHSYRDLVDCITCELHELRKHAEGRL